MTANQRIEALEGALRGLLIDNTNWLDDAADQCKHPGECPASEALCEAIEHARTVLDAKVTPTASRPRGTLADKMARQGLDMPGRLQENSNPEEGRCWLETTGEQHVAEFNVSKVGPMESVILAQTLARLWNSELEEDGPEDIDTAAVSAAERTELLYREMRHAGR